MNIHRNHLRGAACAASSVLILALTTPAQALVMSAHVNNGASSDAALTGTTECGGTGTWDIAARARVSVADTDAKAGTKPGINQVPLSYETRIVNDAGGALNQTVASGKAEINFKGPSMWCATGFTFDASGSYARVVGSGPKGEAMWRVRDPMFFDLSPTVDSLLGGLTLDQGFMLQAQGTEASAHFRTEAHTDAAGYGFLFALDILLGGDGSLPIVSFLSNSLLGLDDATIEALALSALQSGFNVTQNSYELSSALSLFEYRLTGLAGSGQIALSIDQLGEAQAGVPTPGTLALIVLGIALLWRTRQRGLGSA